MLTQTGILPRVLPPSTLLITGCSTGIGYYCAVQCHQLGYKVMATCRNPSDVARIKDLGIDCFECDLANSDSINHAFAQIVQHLHEQKIAPIAGLFNNAAFGLPGAIEDLSRAALEHQFQTNVFGTQELTNLVIPLMRQQGFGRIIYNSSILGFAAMQYRGAYNASKFAIEGLADTLRLELKSTGIQVSLIEPGPILSDFRKNAFIQFKHWINVPSSVHQAQYHAMIDRLETVGPSAPFTLGPDAVCKALLHALQAPHAKIRYRVTVPTRVFAVLKRLLPSRWLDRLLIKAGGDGKR
ncbi:SDR family NAD(P)-dependent oxidoreductase [Thiomicrorhabdus aquaedulcis]|uniref:SDR family NAD(P)-dependent oxidoreductase n=1 Tax=Thiomicrorhabdus aquaedulcis TaxID=2211106 RepID=UPI0030B802A3